jgi:hypothetical protein
MFNISLSISPHSSLTRTQIKYKTPQNTKMTAIHHHHQPIRKKHSNIPRSVSLHSLATTPFNNSEKPSNPQQT